MLEGLLRSYHAMYGLPYVALRYFDVYGPRIERTAVQGGAGALDRPHRPGPAAADLGDGLETMDFVYVDDVAKANVLALQSGSTTT